MAIIPVLRGPVGVAVNSAGTRAYVAEESGFVSVIDTSNNTVVATIPVGSSSVPLGIAVNPAGTIAYVANSGGNNVSGIDTSTNTVVTTVNVQHSPFALGNFVGALPCLGGTPPAEI